MIAFPVAAKLDIAKLPRSPFSPPARGDAERGKQIMIASLKGDAQCMKCHAVRGVGGNVGPDLATIGTKASRENLFESILVPQQGDCRPIRPMGRHHDPRRDRIRLDDRG